jgi:hypothetical protein
MTHSWFSSVGAALALAAASSAAAQPVRSGFERLQQGSSVSGFSVVLVQGDLQSGTVADNVPPAAAKALADLKDFLPYKSYRLLDSQWTMGGVDRLMSKLRGPEGRDYELELEARHARVFGVRSNSFKPTGPGVTIARFHLREISAADQARAEVGIVRAGRQSDSVAAPFRALTPPGTIIHTSFGMDVGETVVVGTSRLQGDKALIVLLTAVPRPQKSAPPR